VPCFPGIRPRQGAIISRLTHEKSVAPSSASRSRNAPASKLGVPSASLKDRFFASAINLAPSISLTEADRQGFSAVRSCPLTLSTHTLTKKDQRFLRDQIAQNLTSPGTEALAALLKEYESALRNPDLSTLTNLSNRLRQIVSERGLGFSANAGSGASAEAYIPPHGGHGYDAWRELNGYNVMLGSSSTVADLLSKPRRLTWP
jgi:hypothetical protein